MKGLWKYISPFAPDTSGAAAVLYALGGILVICDAGGCTGNVCGFDEPRWFFKKSAVFSAGLRDMDAILGRDDRLVEKLKRVAETVEAGFAAIIGTPVPAVIGTDYAALRRLAEKKTGLPVLTVDTDGFELYDKGIEKATLALFKRFAREGFPVEKGRVGVIGLTPLDFSREDYRKVCGFLHGHGVGKVCCYGIDAGLSEIVAAQAVEKNIVVSPGALKTAQYLKETFGTPYSVLDPSVVMENGQGMDFKGKRILIVHQQVRADSLRKFLADRGGDVTVGSFFMQPDCIKDPLDLHFSEEEDFSLAVQKGGFDILLCDKALWPAAGRFAGKKIDLSHFAVSGRE